MNGVFAGYNAVYELISVKPNQRVLDWLEATDENRVFLSVMTLGEIRQGVAALRPSKKRTMLETWLDLQSRFADRVLPVGRAVADRWGRLMAQSQGK
jgi:predicted nucleic acid-binding protein